MQSSKQFALTASEALRELEGLNLSTIDDIYQATIVRAENAEPYHSVGETIDTEAPYLMPINLSVQLSKHGVKEHDLATTKTSIMFDLDNMDQSTASIRLYVAEHTSQIVTDLLTTYARRRSIEDRSQNLEDRIHAIFNGKVEY